MKKVILILLALMLGIWCMENREKVGLSYDLAAKSVKRFLWGTKTVPPAPVVAADESLPAPAEPAVESETPIPVIPKLSTMLTAPELAPDLYFTKERLTMMSDEGIKAIPGGVAVQKIGEQDGKFIIKDEKVQLMVEPHRLTRDPVEIATLKQQAADLQGSLKPPAGAVTNKLNKSKVTTPANKKAPTLITSERAQIEATIMGLDRRIGELRSFVDQKKQADNEARTRGRINSHAADVSQLQSEINNLVKQRTYYYNILKKSR